MEITFHISEFHLLFHTTPRIKSADAASVRILYLLLSDSYGRLLKLTVCNYDFKRQQEQYNIIIFFSMLLSFLSLLVYIFIYLFHLNVKTILDQQHRSHCRFLGTFFMLFITFRVWHFIYVHLLSCQDENNPISHHNMFKNVM